MSREISAGDLRRSNYAYALSENSRGETPRKKNSYLHRYAKFRICTAAVSAGPSIHNTQSKSGVGLIVNLVVDAAMVILFGGLMNLGWREASKLFSVGNKKIIQNQSEL